MKKTTYIIIVLGLIMSGSFTSCKKINSLLEITLNDVQFEVDLDANVNSTKSGSYEFAGTATFNPSDNSEVNDYLETIRSVVIKEIKLTVSSITPATGVSLLDATFSLTDNVNAAEFTHTISTVTPLIVGTEFVFNENTPNFNIVSAIITDMHAATVSLTGHVNQPGLIIGFNSLITADITVGVPEGK